MDNRSDDNGEQSDVKQDRTQNAQSVIGKHSVLSFSARLLLFFRHCHDAFGGIRQSLIVIRKIFRRRQRSRVRGDSGFRSR